MSETSIILYSKSFNAFRKFRLKFTAFYHLMIWAWDWIIIKAFIEILGIWLYMKGLIFLKRILLRVWLCMSSSVGLCRSDNNPVFVRVSGFMWAWRVSVCGDMSMGSSSHTSSLCILWDSLEKLESLHSKVTENNWARNLFTLLDPLR